MLDIDAGLNAERLARSNLDDGKLNARGIMASRSVTLRNRKKVEMGQFMLFAFTKVTTPLDNVLFKFLPEKKIYTIIECYHEHNINQRKFYYLEFNLEKLNRKEHTR